MLMPAEMDCIVNDDLYFLFFNSTPNLPQMYKIIGYNW